MIRKKRYAQALFLLALTVSLILAGNTTAAAGEEIRSIRLETKPYGIRIKLTGKVPYKVVQFDKKEILVAFKNTTYSGVLKPSGTGKPLIRDVALGKRKGNVVSLVISTQKEMKSVSSVWIPVGNTLLVTPVLPGVTGYQAEKPEKADKQSDKKSPELKAGTSGSKTSQLAVSYEAGDGTDDEDDPFSDGPVAPVVQKDVTEYTLGGRTFDKRFSGTSDDLFLELRSDACESLNEVKRAVILCKQNAWSRAYEILENYADDDTLGVRCLENIMILRAYSFYKSVRDDDSDELLRAAGYFQELLSFFPDSVYTPYALTALGKIHVKLGDLNQAEGYFQVVLKMYQDYPGTPEVMFELGRIFTENNNPKHAIKILRKVVSQFPKGSFIGNAKLELGKALFNINDFSGAVTILEDVLKNHPRMEFESPDLLQFLGNAYYHTGKRAEARTTLAKAFNLFPEIKGRDTLMTRIGDTYAEEKHKDKAIKIFEFVIETFPGTDGFVISSMRLAEYLEEREKKEELYNMIIKDFPDNPLSRLAMMRLALLQHGAGEFDKSISTVKALLETQPRALKKDAVNLLQDSSEQIFRDLLSDNEYTVLLERFEADKKILDKAESPNLFLLVGMAYLKAHLYENAVDLLLKSYKRTGKSKRPPDLVYSLGVAMDEADRSDEALKMLGAYVKYFSTADNVADAYGRIGVIYLEKKMYSKSIDYLTKAFSRSKVNKSKAAFLVNKSRSYKELRDYKTAVNTLIQAINLLAGEPDESFETLAFAHRNLGENYMKLNEWKKASDAFSMAVKFSGEEPGIIELYFMLGESYEKSKEYAEAKKAYQNVVEKGDSFWSSMAKERLRGMALVQKLEKT